MATQSKSQFLTDVHTLLKRRYKPKADRSRGPAHGAGGGRLRDLPRGHHARAGQPGALPVQGRVLRLERGPRQPDRRDPGDARRLSPTRGTGPAHPPVPPPALREDLRLHPRCADQEAAQGSAQGPPGIRGVLVRLRHGDRRPAGPRRPRDPDRRVRSAPGAVGVAEPKSPALRATSNGPCPRTAASSSST